MKSIIHVNQHHIRKNHKNQSNTPVITIKQSGKTLYAWGVEFTGPCKLEYHESDPLSCGARVWISTNDDIILLDSENQPFEGLKYKDI